MKNKKITVTIKNLGGSNTQKKYEGQKAQQIYDCIASAKPRFFIFIALQSITISVEGQKDTTTIIKRNNLLLINGKTFKIPYFKYKRVFDSNGKVKE